MSTKYEPSDDSRIVGNPVDKDGGPSAPAGDASTPSELPVGPNLGVGPAGDASSSPGAGATTGPRCADGQHVFVSVSPPVCQCQLAASPGVGEPPDEEMHPEYGITWGDFRGRIAALQRRWAMKYGAAKDVDPENESSYKASMDVAREKLEGALREAREAHKVANEACSIVTQTCKDLGAMLEARTDELREASEQNATWKKMFLTEQEVRQKAEIERADAKGIVRDQDARIVGLEAEIREAREQRDAMDRESVRMANLATKTALQRDHALASLVRVRDELEKVRSAIVCAPAGTKANTAWRGISDLIPQLASVGDPGTKELRCACGHAPHSTYCTATVDTGRDEPFRFSICNCALLDRSSSGDTDPSRPTPETDAAIQAAMLDGARPLGVKRNYDAGDTPTTEGTNAN